jgi:hypothetical protein
MGLYADLRRGGQWTVGANASANTASSESFRGDKNEGPVGADKQEIAGTIISVCIASGIARSVDRYGVGHWAANFDCPGGQTIRLEGIGNAPGLVRDPFQK